MKKLLDYRFPQELKNMSIQELDLLAYEIRDFLIDNISKTGGHLASNLGVVELSIALHKVFDTPKDKLVWDVGHQSYVHKILTGRADRFSTLRQFGGMSGFPKVKESPYDTFDVGHSSTSISMAAGLAASRDLAGEDYHVTAIIGDGAMTGGLAYEALNNVGASKTNLMVILNDNGMSISQNTGGVSEHLGRLRGSRGYADFKRKLKKNMSEVPWIGKHAVSGLQHVRDLLKYAILDGVIFEELGFKYFGPIDGHNLEILTETLEMAKNVEGPVFVHIITKKGKGYRNAEELPSKFHGTGPFDPSTGLQHKSGSSRTYSDIFGSSLLKKAAEDEKIVAISAAMVEGTGLSQFKKQYPKRTFDVGIAEGHAVSFASGLAAGGYKPVVCVYSTFLQRAYDQIAEDICLQDLPVIFAVDRAGIVGADGETHHGIFDLSYLTHLPNMTVLTPSDGAELSEMLDYALKLGHPCAIRYPRGEAARLNLDPVPLPQSRTVFPKTRQDAGEAENIQKTDVEIWAAGNMTKTAIEVRQVLEQKNLCAGVVDVRAVKPLDEKTLTASADRAELIITLEDNVIQGGFGQKAAALLSQRPNRVISMGWPDRFIEHGSCEQLLNKYKLDAFSIAERICEYIERQT